MRSGIAHGKIKTANVTILNASLLIVTSDQYNQLLALSIKKANDDFANLPGKICDRCHGSGELYSAVMTLTCFVCNGSGKIKENE